MVNMQRGNPASEIRKLIANFPGFTTRHGSRSSSLLKIFLKSRAVQT